MNCVLFPKDKSNLYPGFPSTGAQISGSAIVNPSNYILCFDINTQNWPGGNGGFWGTIQPYDINTGSQIYFRHNLFVNGVCCDGHVDSLSYLGWTGYWGNGH